MLSVLYAVFLFGRPVLACAGPLPGDAHPLVGLRGRDTLFVLAVEDWVRAGRSERHFESVLPPDLLVLVRQLAADHHAERQAAEAAIRDHPLGPRAAFWGLTSSQPEVHNASVRLLKGFLRCPHCRGTGLCPTRSQILVYADAFAPCLVCPYPHYRAGEGMNEADLRDCLNCHAAGFLTPDARPCVACARLAR